MVHTLPLCCARRVHFVALLIMLLCQGLRPHAAQVARGALKSENSLSLFAPTRLVEVKINLDSKDWDNLRKEHQDIINYLSKKRLTTPPAKVYKTYSARLEIDGKMLGEIGIRKKGFLGSSDFQRPSVNLLVNHKNKSNTLDGLNRLALNNNKQDPSQIHQILSYAAFERAGVPAPRCNLAHVIINGRSLGIYSMVEPVDAAFIKRHWTKSNGNLYEGTISDFRPEWVNGFEKKNNDPKERKDLDALVQALEIPGEGFLQAVEKHVDIDKFLSFWATEGLIGHWDGYCNNQNNFFVYQNPGTGKLDFIPWGADATFGEKDPFTQYEAPESVKAVSILPRRLYLSAGVREQYRNRVRDLLKTVWKENEILEEVNRLEALVRPQVHIAKQQFEEALKGVRSFISGRRVQVLPELDGPAPEWTHPLKLAPYFEEIGTFQATFETVWHEKLPQNPFGQGKAKIQLQLNGTNQVFLMSSCIAGPSTKTRSAGTPSIVLFGLSSPGTRYAGVIALVDQEYYLPNQWNDVDGFTTLGAFMEGTVGKGEPKIGGLLSGKLMLEKAGSQEGAPVSGSIQGKVLRFGQ